MSCFLQFCLLCGVWCECMVCVCLCVVCVCLGVVCGVCVFVCVCGVTMFEWTSTESEDDYYLSAASDNMSCFLSCLHFWFMVLGHSSPVCHQVKCKIQGNFLRATSVFREMSQLFNTGFQHTVFVLIEARRSSAGISPSETVLISRENNYCDTTYPLYITSFHCYMTYWTYLHI